MTSAKFKIVYAALVVLACDIKADAHGVFPVLKPPHFVFHVSPQVKQSTNASSFVGINFQASGAARAYIQSLKLITNAGIKEGMARAPLGGVLTGGVIQGDLYVANPTPYFNSGIYTLNISYLAPNAVAFSNFGNNAISPGNNTLTFAAIGKSGSGGTIGPPSALLKLPGSARTLQSIYNLAASSAINSGQTLAPRTGTLLGGVLTGTYYNGIGTPPHFSQAIDSHFVFAFGNNPLNNPSGVPGGISFIPTSSTLTFNTGSFNVPSGQLFGTFSSVYFGTHSPNPPFGVFFAIGSNPFNIHYGVPPYPQISFLKLY